MFINTKLSRPMLNIIPTHRFYGAGISVTKQMVNDRVFSHLSLFDKIDPEKVLLLYKNL